MIGYDNMTFHDASRYFGGCVAFHRDSNLVRAGVMLFDDPEDQGDELAHDCEILIRWCDNNQTEYVTGNDLWYGYQWITHRFGLGYVEVNDRLVRVSGEPQQTSMVKGLSQSFLRYLPVLDDSNVGTAPNLGSYDTYCGIANVLGYRLVPVVRPQNPVSREEWYTKARDETRRFMQDVTRSVFVPHFNWAIVRHRTYPEWAYALRCGKHVGYLFSERGSNSALFQGIRPSSGPKEVTVAVRDGMAQEARQFFSADPEWVDDNPIGGKVNAIF